MPAASLDAITAALATVNDPEINRPVTELGMVKAVDAHDDGAVTVGIYLTVSGCPMRTTIVDRITEAVSAVPGVASVTVELDKTIVVLVEDRKKHPLYGKVMRLSKKVKAHDENNTAGVGDLVLIDETRPLSATKNWRLVEILEKAK